MSNRILPHIFHQEVYKYTEHADLYHHGSHTFGDSFAYVLAKSLARCMDVFFGSRYGHRAVVLETIAAVPGMVAGMLHHLKSLRLIRDDNGLIETMLHEAENERMHLIIYSTLFKATFIERLFVALVQFIFFIVYATLYIVSAKTAHRLVGYFEELAVHSYTRFEELVQSGLQENIPAPPMAIAYWSLPSDARLLDMIRATLRDECIHRDVNHDLATHKGKEVSFFR